ncbi:MAG: hypothetical protein H6718_16360 [Polyangiaceae bacterium]|nr:hypothetical protein [Myxococcales bacterium]MCB9586973.1 hypothetical protein [Polyangiaceae bacterium]
MISRSIPAFLLAAVLASSPALAQDTTSSTQTKEEDSDDPGKAKSEATSRHELKTGTLAYGPTATLLRFNATRRSSEAGRNRRYEPDLQLVNGELGFQFVWEPNSWGKKTKSGGHLQLAGVGGAFLFNVVKDRQRSLSLATQLTFFNNSLGLGLGFDLYRQIPISTSSTDPAEGIAHTGLLAWSFSGEGELTAENVFFVASINLASLVKGLSGDGK